MTTSIPANMMTAYQIALKQIVESDATPEQKAVAKASLDALMSMNNTK